METYRNQIIAGDCIALLEKAATELEEGGVLA